LATSSDEEFWKEQYDTGGNHPGVWFSKACSLLTAADVLDKFAGNCHKAIAENAMTGHSSIPKSISDRMDCASVSPMLHAMATECLLKALWLRHGGMLTSDGKYVGILKKNEHALDKLALAISEKGNIPFSDREFALLKQASYWISSGRYPVQKSHKYLVPHTHEDGSIAPSQFWRGDPHKELNTLVEKLKDELGIKTRFGNHS
jgi:hypothetical protein